MNCKAQMDESSLRDCNKGEERASSLPKKHRTTAKSVLAKPKERKRRFGIAQLERIRAEKEISVEEEIKKYFKGSLSQPSIHGVGIQSLMTYGARQEMSGPFKLPMIRSPGTVGGTVGAASYVNSNSTIPTTLQLFEAPHHREYAYMDLKRKDDDNISETSSCKNFNDDPQDLDLNLKL